MSPIPVTRPAPAAPGEPPLRRAIVALGGGRGALLASLPTVGYVLGDALGGLRTGAAAGIAAGLVVLGERLRAGARVTPALAGFVGVAALVGLALSSGRPTAFFLPAVLTLLAESGAVACAALAGRPVTGGVARQLHEVPSGWRSQPPLRRLFVEQDLVWAVLLALRAAITAAFVITGSVAGAGLFRLTGTPMYIALVAVCVRWARPVVRRHRTDSTCRSVADSTCRSVADSTCRSVADGTNPTTIAHAGGLRADRGL